METANKVDYKSYMVRSSIFYGVYYKILLDNGEFDDKTSDKKEACWSYVMSSAIKNNSVEIISWIDKYQSPYEPDIIQRWLDLMNEWGFHVSKFEYTEDKYTFTILFQDHINRAHLACTLNLLRYLWERSGNSIPSITLSLMDEYPQAESFKLMQYAHHLCEYLDSEHALGYGGKMPLLSKEVVFSRINNYGNKMFGDYTYSVHSIWTNFTYVGKRKEELLKEII